MAFAVLAYNFLCCKGLEGPKVKNEPAQNTAEQHCLKTMIQELMNVACWTALIGRRLILQNGKRFSRFKTLTCVMPANNTRETSMMSEKTEQ